MDIPFVSHSLGKGKPVPIRSGGLGEGFISAIKIGYINFSKHYYRLKIIFDTNIFV